MNNKLLSLMLFLMLCHIAIGENRILSELSESSTKWQFRQFSTQVEQNMETIVLPNGELLFVQSQVNEQGAKTILLQKYGREGLQIGQAQIFGDSSRECTRAKVSLIPGIGFALGFIENQIEQSYFIIQIFNYSLQAITSKQLIGPVHLEVHWDMISEFHYLLPISGTKLQLFYKPPSQPKTWNALVFDYSNNSRTNEITLPYSKILEIAINNIQTIVVLQKIEKELNCQVSILNIDGQLQRTQFLTQYYYNGQVQIQNKIIALSNNNFVVVFTNYYWISVFLYDSRFSTVIQSNSNNYYYYYGITGTTTARIYRSWEYQNYFQGGQIQMQALQGSFVIVGINIYDFKFRLLQLNNQLQYIQLREVHYDNLNIYKYFIQKTDDSTIFVQWIDGMPETLLPEYKQNLYQSELSLKLTINDCSANCAQCSQYTICQQCNPNYNLIDGKCQLQCIDNCNVCSNELSCDICNNGYYFNHQMQCIQSQVTQNSEVRISVSDTTFKQGTKFKILDNRNIVMIYKEQKMDSDILQIKLLDQYGATLQQFQLEVLDLINYDLIIQDSTVFIYIFEVITASNLKITLYKHSLETLGQIDRITLPLNNYGYYNIQYYNRNTNYFEVVQFPGTFTIIFQGFNDYYWQRVVSYTYDFNGNLLNNYFLGDFYVWNLFYYNVQQFDITNDEYFIYVVLSRQCDLQLTVLDQNGYIVRQDTQQQYNCLYLLNPSISIIPFTGQLLMSIQDANDNIFVFIWQNDIIFQMTKTEGLQSSQLIALTANSFILVLEEFNINENYKTLNYIHFDQGQIVSKLILNQNSIQPGDVRVAIFDDTFLYVAWTGFKNVMQVTTNQVYLQQVSISEDKVLGLVKICGSNCMECDDSNKCITCIQDYLLTSTMQCQLACSDNCYYCEQINTCSICSIGFSLNSSNQCIQGSTNFVKLQENNNRIELNQQVGVNSKGNILVTWMSYDQKDNRYRSYLKIFDQHGVQQSEQMLDVCSNVMLTKFATMNDFIVMAVLCDDGLLRLAMLNADMNYILGWQGVFGIRLANSNPGNYHFDIATNNFNQIFIIAQDRYSWSENEYYLLCTRITYDYFANSLAISSSSNQFYYDQQLTYLKLRADTNFVYYTFEMLKYNPDTGINEIITKNVRADINFQEIQSDIVNFESINIVLGNSKTLEVIKLATELQIKISNNRYSLFTTSIVTGMTMEHFDIAQFKGGFAIVWTSSVYSPDYTLTLNSQTFYNNGTKITDATQLATFSNFPSNPQIESLQNGDLIVVWNDIDETGKSLFGARYNKFLQQIPLTSVICQQNCEVCLTTSYCQRCFDQYYFNGQTCKVQCSGSCTSCSIPYTCEVCQNGYFMENNQCFYDQFRVEEEVITQIQDIQKTRVSITSFSDTSFVVAWNNNIAGLQSLFFRFYDNNRKPIGEIQSLLGDNDRQYAQIKALADDTLAVAWFDGDCTVQCRLVLQIFNKNLAEQTTEIFIAQVTLPIIEKQSPVVIQRQDNQLIIAYLSYENQMTTAYYGIYSIADLLMLTPIQIEADATIDNLDIIVYNSDMYSILYVKNNIQLKAIIIRNGETTSKIIYDNTNIISTPTNVVNELSGNIAIGWSEKVLTDDQFINKIMVTYVDSYFNEIQPPAKMIETYHTEQLEQPKFMGKNNLDQLDIFYRSYDFSTKMNKKISAYNINTNYFGSYGQRQVSYFSYEHNYFQIQQLQYWDYIIVDVGLNSQLQPTIFIMRVDGFGNQIKMGDVVCPQNCKDCLNNHSCTMCQDGYDLWNGNYCSLRCPPNYLTCEPGQMVCINGYWVDEFQECKPLDPEKAQQLINTYQYSEQTQQNIATLSNYYSVVVWQSQQQDQNGVAIYMQKFDTKFSKVGAETLITKDSIGVQEAPNIAALYNNQFVVIWKDSNANNVLRIIMQRFSFEFERIGNEIVVYDSTASDILQDAFIINFSDTQYKLQVLQNGNLAVLLRQSYTQANGQSVRDLRLKLFDANLVEYSTQLIGQSSCCDYYDSITSIENVVYVIWRNQSWELNLLSINSAGDVINGKTITTEYTYSPSIIGTDSGQLVIGWVSSYQITLQRYDLSLIQQGDAYKIASQVYIENMQLSLIAGGFVVTFQTSTQTPLFYTNSISLQVFDNYFIPKSTLISQVNDFRGYISNIKSQGIGNGQFVVTWSEWLYISKSWDTRSERDSSGSGIYVKRYDSAGNILPITNVVCQTNCKQCSQVNLCESCQDGYVFDNTKSICLLQCPDNCTSCYQDSFWRSSCSKCNDGFIINGNRQCDKIENNNGNEYYLLGDSSSQVIDQITLQNGSIVVVYWKSYWKEIYFKIIDNQGVVIVDESQIWNASGYQELVKCTALTSGHFAIIRRSFYTQNSNQVWLCVYDPNGVLIRNQAIVNYALWNYYYWWYQPAYNSNLLSIKSLSNGGFAIIYMNDNNGRSYIKPKLFLRIYGSEFYQTSNDILLKTDPINAYYWDWWNQNSISILETQNNLIISYNYYQYYWWNYDLSKVQISQIDKSDFSLTNKFIDFTRSNISSWSWWYNYYQSFQLWQIESDKFLCFRPFPQGLIGTYLDSSFTVIEEKIIRNTDYQYWYFGCLGCCPACWNQQSFQLLQLDNSFIMSYYDQKCYYYQCYNFVKIQPLSFNLEKIAVAQEIKYIYQHQYISTQQSVMKKYLNNNLLLMSAIYLNDYSTVSVVFDKFDFKCNKLQKWQLNCPQNCQTCINQHNSVKCMECSDNYYLDYDSNCKLNCQFDHCLACGNSGTLQQYCYQCESGYQLKDNYYCVQSDSTLTVEEKIAESYNLRNYVPRVKTLSDGTIITISLLVIENQYTLLGQLFTKDGFNIGEIAELQTSKSILYFDFSTSSQDEILVTWTDNSAQIIIKGQKYDKNLQLIGDLFTIYDSYQTGLGAQFATVEYLENDSFAVVLIGNGCLYMSTFDSNLSSIGTMIIDCSLIWWDSWYYYNYNYYQYDYPYYSYDFLYYLSPIIVSTQDYIIILYQQHYSGLAVRTYDYNQNLIYATNLRSNQPAIQPSMTILENGNLVIVWKDKLDSNGWLLENTIIGNYEQSNLVYAITNPQFNFVQYHYFGMDNVSEYKPDIQSIPNGFTISWSGISETNSRYIDLRVAYFDLNGNLQTGFISVSSICSEPRNSQIASLRDGSVVVTWFQGSWIYMQKVDRFGQLQPLNTVICSSYCKKCSIDNTCDTCLAGYALNSNGYCQEICLLENCSQCSYWSNQCGLCKIGYFLDESLQHCNFIDSTTNLALKLEQSNLRSSVVISNGVGDIIHLWIQYSSEMNSYQLFGQSLTWDGSQIIYSQLIVQLTQSYDQILATYNQQFQLIVVVLTTYSEQSLITFNDSFEKVTSEISLASLLQEEYPLGFSTWSFQVKPYVDGFALISRGTRKQILDQFSSNPQLVTCNIPEILLFDLSGNLTTPSITFWSNERMQNGFLDQNKQCYNWNLKDVVFSDQIYVVITDNNDPYNYNYIQAYDYSGLKQKERNVKDFLGIDQWWKSISLARYDNGDFQLLGFNSQLIRLTSNFDLISNDYTGFVYDSEIDIVSSSFQYVAAISRQQYNLVNRYKLLVYDINSRVLVHQDFISQSAVYQNSVSYLSQSNGNIVFTWQEIGQGSADLGTMYIVRSDNSGSLIKFQQFSCLPNCNQCQVATKCTVCSDSYHLDSNFKCAPTCSDNCSSCSVPGICDICNSGYYSNDSQQCLSIAGLPSEKSINSQTSDTQVHVRVAQFSDGSGVIVWQSNSQDGSEYGVYAQKFNSEGNKIGKEIRVSINTIGSQYFPDVTTLSNGNVIVIWADGDIETQASLYYQRFNNTMERVGVPTFIDFISVPWVTFYDVPCVVWSLSDNRFTVIWININQTFVTVFDETGVRTNTYPIDNYDSYKEIVVASNQMNFVVIYRQSGLLKGSIFDVNGNYLTCQLIADSPQASSPGISVNSLGQYIIAWEQDGIINYQLFDSQLIKLGQQFQVQLIDNVFSDNPDVITLSNGFVIVWQNRDRLSTRSRKVRIQLFDINGVTLGDSIEVDVVTLFGQNPQLSLLNNDEFVVVWSAYNSISNVDEGSGIYMMKFASDGTKQLLAGITCPNRCETCSNSDTCVTCVEDYVLNSNVCVPQCPQYCGSCSAPYSCDICSDGYKLDPSGYCSYITADLMPEDPLLTTPLDTMPSFQSSLQVGDGVIIYTGAVSTVSSAYSFEIGLRLINGDNSNEFTYSIPIASITTNIIHSDIIVKEDNSIQVYWVEVVSITVIRIRVITVSFELVITEEETILDTITLINSASVHEESRVYLYYSNTKYYVVHSIYAAVNKYQVYQHQVSATYVRINEPSSVVELQRQISYTQILFSIDTVVILEYTETYIFRTYRFSIDFVTVDIRETVFDSGYSYYLSSFSLRRLRNNGYVVCWRSSTTKSLSSKSLIYYSMFDEQLNRNTNPQVISQSSGELGNPLIIILETKFAVIWNNQVSVSYSQLSISYYDNYGGYISTTTQLNTISNNIKFYNCQVINKTEILINWISQVTVEYHISYQIYIAAINQDGIFLPSPTLVCLGQCSTCMNQFTCLTCADKYYMNDTTSICDPLCPSSCTTCATPTVCSSCADGYSLNSTTSQCDKNPCFSGCEKCNLLQQCLGCAKNYYLDPEDTRKCIGTCGPNCKVCTQAPNCDTCEDSFYWSKMHTECVDITIAITGTDIDSPLIATFPTGDYVAMWNQQGALSGVYFQVYRKNGTKVGGKTKVNWDDLGNRRLLQTSDGFKIEKTLFSDLATFAEDFVVLWVDQTVGDMKVKLKKFNTDGVATSNEITITELPKQNLEGMVAPCMIKKTSDNNFVVGFFSQIEEQVTSSATMFVQSFSNSMEPIGKMQALANTDVTKAPMISASEDGVISITFSSNGNVYLTQISTEGEYVNEPMPVAEAKAFKSTNLKNNKIVFVFEAVSTNVSPPQYVLEYQIMNSEKQLTSPVLLTTPQYGEENPFVNAIGEDFIVAWRTVDSSLKSQDVIFQMFDEFGNQISYQTKVTKQGLYPKNPSIQILNDNNFYITWTAQASDLTDSFFMQGFTKSDLLIDPIVPNVTQVENNATSSTNVTLPIQCSSNCIVCSNIVNCDRCSDGYYTENGLCTIDCPANCSTCSKPLQCDDCQEGYELTLSHTCDVINCGEGFKLNENYECIPYCSENCAECQSFKVCLTCDKTYFLDSGKCQKNIVTETEPNTEPLAYYYIIVIVLGSVVLIGLLILATWYYNNKTKANRARKLQQRQVVDQRDNTYLGNSAIPLDRNG